MIPLSIDPRMISEADFPTHGTELRPKNGVSYYIMLCLLRLNIIHSHGILRSVVPSASCMPITPGNFL